MSHRFPIRARILVLCLGLLAGASAANWPAIAPISLSSQWSTVNLADQPMGVFAHNGVLWVCGAHEMIAASTDGGRTWVMKNRDNHGEMLFSIGFAGDKVAYAAGASGVLLKSTDGGENWQTMVKANGSIGWMQTGFSADGAAFAASDGEFASSKDGGKSWQTHGLPLPAPPAAAPAESEDGRGRGGRGQMRAPVAHRAIRELAVLDNGAAAVLFAPLEGQSDAVAYTTDRGQNWQVFAFAPTVRLSGLVTAGDHYTVFGADNATSASPKPFSAASTDGRQWHEVPPLPTAVYGCNGAQCRVNGGWLDFSGAHPAAFGLAQDEAGFKNWAAVKDTFCGVGSDLECALGNTNFALSAPSAPAGPMVFAYNESSAPKCLACPLPVGTTQTQSEHHGGIVLMQAVVNSDGSLHNLTVDDATWTDLAELAQSEVRKWRFEPPPAGQPTLLMIPVAFSAGRSRGGAASDSGDSDDSGSGRGGRGRGHSGE